MRRGRPRAAVGLLLLLVVLVMPVAPVGAFQLHPFHRRHHAPLARSRAGRQHQQQQQQQQQQHQQQVPLYAEAPSTSESPVAAEVPSPAPSPFQAAAAPPAAPASASTSYASFLAGWTPVLPDLSSLGAEVLGSAAAEANSTLIGLLQVAQAAMNSRSVTRTFSRQFSKRYLARWNDKTGLKEMVEQTLADLVRVTDTIDVHSNLKVASFAARVRAQLETLRRDHDARVIYFFNEAPDTISEVPTAPSAFPLPRGHHHHHHHGEHGHGEEGYEGEDGYYYDDEEEEEEGSRPSLFGPRRVPPGAGAVKKKQEFVRLFKGLLSLARQAEQEPEVEDMSWFEAPSGETTAVAFTPAPAPAAPSGAGQSGVDRLLQQVRRRMESKAAEARKSEEAVVKAGLRLEFERWQLLEASRYLSENLSKARDLILGAATSGSAGVAANVSREVLGVVPPPLRSLFGDFEATLAQGGLPLPVKLDLAALTSVMRSVAIGHRPHAGAPFPQRDWRSAMELLASQAPLPDPLLEGAGLNHPLFLHSSLLIATTPYNLALTPQAEMDPRLLQRTALVAAKALGIAPSRLRVEHVVSDKACAVLIIVPERRATYVTFRGTKDPVDVLTDINFLSARFTPLGWDEEADDEWGGDGGAGAGGGEEDTEGGAFPAGFLPFIDPHAAQDQLQLMTGADDGTGALRVHGGFKLAFDSIKDRVTEVLLEKHGATDHVVFVGHSMGGALAQLATVYYCELKARLVTFASPAIGNAAFCRLLDCCGQPYGGLRVWNDYDVVPSIAQLVGYKHAGVPIKLDVSKSAKELFEEENVNSLRGLIDFLAPHVMFQLGSICVVFPIIGWDVKSGGLKRLQDQQQQMEEQQMQRQELQEEEAAAAAAAAAAGAGAGVPLQPAALPFDASG